MTQEELKLSRFEKELEELINRHSMENFSDTPDFILAEMLVQALNTYSTTVKKRDDWFGFKAWQTEVREPEVLKDGDNPAPEAVERPDVNLPANQWLAAHLRALKRELLENVGINEETEKLLNAAAAVLERIPATLKRWTAADGVPPDALYLIGLNPGALYPLSVVKGGYIVRGDKECPVSDWISNGFDLYGRIEVDGAAE